METLVSRELNPRGNLGNTLEEPKPGSKRRELSICLNHISTILFPDSPIYGNQGKELAVSWLSSWKLSSCSWFTLDLTTTYYMHSTYSLRVIKCIPRVASRLCWHFDFVFQKAFEHFHLHRSSRLELKQYTAITGEYNLYIYHLYVSNCSSVQEETYTKPTLFISTG
jgi:hypothetical protein